MPVVKAEWSVQTVGEIAGQIWEWLHHNGKATLSTVERGIEAPAAVVHMAIGWLAREGKLELRQDGRQTQLWLTEQ